MTDSAEKMPDEIYVEGVFSSTTSGYWDTDKTSGVKYTRSDLAPSRVTGDEVGEVKFIGDKRLMVDPSVPEDMVLFPDEATRKWYIARPERLIDCLKSIRKHLQKKQDEKVNYDFNADPLYTTLIEGWINVALDTEDFCPDWMCQAECPARESLKEHLEIQASRPTQDSADIFTEEEIAAVVKKVWIETKPSREAQRIRAKLRFDSGKDKYTSEADAMPSYIWDVVDIAVQTALAKAPPPEADRQRALEALEKLANTPMEISLADWQEIVRPILAYLTAPQPHVGVEVTVEELAKALTEEMRDPRHADVQTDKYYANKFETPLRILLDKFHITKITAQKKGG